MGYNSPIELFAKQMETELDGNIFKVIQEYGVSVDKEELIKALQYDRQQYEKGYTDALPKWISVKERLPEEKTEVIAVDKDGVMLIGEITIEEFPSKNYVCLSWNDYLKDVTHWQQLPEPPKESEE